MVYIIVLKQRKASCLKKSFKKIQNLI